MILNYLKLAFRLLSRNPFFTLINVLGLAIGVAMFYVLWQYSTYELRSDQFHRDHARIVRLGGISPRGSLGKERHGNSHMEISRRMKSDLDEIEDLTRIINQENFKWKGIPYHDNEIIMSTVKWGDQKIAFAENKVAYADPNIFTFFTIPLIRGSGESVLIRSHSMVLSEQTATKYFGTEDPVGKILTINDSIDFTVTGVFNLPHNSHLDFEILISTITIGPAIFSIGMQNSFAHCYFKLREGVNIETFEQKLNQLADMYFDDLNRIIGF